MLTRWGETLDKNNVLGEYPRPQMRRSSFINLNGPPPAKSSRTNGMGKYLSPSPPSPSCPA